MAVHVDSSARVDPHAELGEDVHVGPFCHVGPNVRIGAGTRLEGHVTVMGDVDLGQRNRLFPGVVVGGDPQDITYRGSDTRVAIGDDNVIREAVTINRGSEKEEGVTTVGSGCYLMACGHVAHDCRIGDRVIMANAVLLGGHVHVHSDAILSGGVAVHHFSSIGSFAFVAGLARIIHDVPPYLLVEGQPGRPRCVNLVALKRNNFSSEAIRALTECYRLLYRSRTGLDHAREILRAKGMLLPAVNHLLSFVQNQQEGSHGRGRERRRAA